jgi:hypothetical protein
MRSNIVPATDCPATDPYLKTPPPCSGVKRGFELAIFVCSAMKLMQSVERDATDFVTIVVGDEHSVVAVSKVRALAQQPPRQLISRIHRLDIAGQIGATGNSDSSGVDQIKMVEWH